MKTTVTHAVRETRAYQTAPLGSPSQLKIDLTLSSSGITASETLTTYMYFYSSNITQGSSYGTYYFCYDEETEDAILALAALSQPNGLSWDELKRKHGL